MRNLGVFVPVGILYIQAVTNVPSYVSGNAPGDVARNFTIEESGGMYNYPESTSARNMGIVPY